MRNSYCKYDCDENRWKQLRMMIKWRKTPRIVKDGSIYED